VLAHPIVELFRLPNIHAFSAFLIRQENGVHDVPTVTHDVESLILQPLAVHARKPEKAPIPYRNLNFAYETACEQPNKKATLLPCEQRSQQTESLLAHRQLFSGGNQKCTRDPKSKKS
jgi:hypothetical protein